MRNPRISTKIISKKEGFIVAEINVVASNKMKQLKSVLLKKLVFNFEEKIVRGSIMMSIFKSRNLPLQPYGNDDANPAPYYINYGLLTSKEYINQAINTIIKEFNDQTKIQKMHILLTFDHVEWAVDIKPNLNLHLGITKSDFMKGIDCE